MSENVAKRSWIFSGVTAERAFKILFWVHQVVIGVPAAFIGFEILSTGTSDGIVNAIGLLLAWIGGTLLWGLAALIHRHTQ